MPITVGSTDLDIGFRNIIQVGDDRFLEIESGAFAQPDLTIRDSEGTIISDRTALIPDTEPRLPYSVWHARDDGDGAFTLFVQGRQDSNNQTNLLTLSFDAEGNQIAQGTYEQPYFAEWSADVAIDLDDGAIMGVFQVPGFSELRIWDADGDITFSSRWSDTSTGASSSQGRNLEYALTRSGDTVFIFYNNDDFTNIGGDPGETFLVRVNTDGSFVTPASVEEKVSTGDHYTLGAGTARSIPIDATTLEDGKVVVIWASEQRATDDGQFPTTGNDVWMRIYNPDGSTFLGETQINDPLDGYQGEVKVFALNTGGFVVLYHEFGDNSRNTAEAIFQVFDANGNVTTQVTQPLPDDTPGESTVIFPDGTGVVIDFTGAFAISITPDVTLPSDGDDTITGDGSNEVIDGLAGDDSLAGGAGDDTLIGGLGNDRLAGEDGADSLEGGDGDDTALGGDGNDTIRAGAGDDRASGGNDDDRMFGGAGEDDLFGNAGDDSLFGQDGDDSLSGSSGADSLRGGAGEDTLNGGSGNDRLFGEDGDDSGRGGSGDDLMVGGDGNDTLDGDGDNDRLIGNDGNDSLRAGSGDDTLSGGAGDDTLRGEAGSNELDGGSGNDKLYGGTGAETITGGSGDDTLVGNGAADRLNGETGDDVLYGSDGNDTLDGRDGADWLSGGNQADLVLGREGNDTMRGGNADDRLYGGNDNDLIAGNNGADQLFGGSGNDRLFGGGGNDQITGGTGRDTMGGGDGVDVFIFNTVSESPHTSARDRIVDFTAGVDKIDLSGLADDLTFVESYSGTGGEVLYSETVGRLYVDIDGDGWDLSINLSGDPALTETDLLL
ncbi:calcium-binding protein [Primorskyibacter sp. S187A]|uniref:calcium-binding protein n=1 Tax=Primorskyibacter sp. S187A TaxID=3415130 RepID=UPI003C7C92DA